MTETVQPEPHAVRAPAITMQAQSELLRDGNITGFHCNGCDYDQFSPMVRCPKCRGSDIGTRQFSGTGKVVSYTIQTVASEEFINETPFAFAVIQLDDGPKVSGWIPWISRSDDLPMGQAVKYYPSYKPGMQFEKC